MVKPEIEAALNAQVNQEQAAAHKYLAMAAWFEQENFAGFAAFMRRQADEERTHAMKLFDFLCDRGGRIRLGSIPEPTGDFASCLAVFEEAYRNEQANTKSIHELYALAKQLDDYATQTMLHWFIDEQVEEEQWCEEAIGLLAKAGDNPGALLMLDRQYGSKTGEADEG